MTETEALTEVWYAASLVTQAEVRLAMARGALALAMREALTSAPKDQVAAAARVTPSAMYKALRKVYGPRKITNEKER